jgi:hypothetical protein
MMAFVERGKGKIGPVRRVAGSERHNRLATSAAPLPTPDRPMKIFTTSTPPAPGSRSWPVSDAGHGLQENGQESRAESVVLSEAKDLIAASTVPALDWAM